MWGKRGTSWPWWSFHAWGPLIQPLLWLGATMKLLYCDNVFSKLQSRQWLLPHKSCNFCTSKDNWSYSSTRNTPIPFLVIKWCIITKETCSPLLPTGSNLSKASHHVDVNKCVYSSQLSCPPWKATVVSPLRCVGKNQAHRGTVDQSSETFLANGAASSFHEFPSLILLPSAVCLNSGFKHVHTTPFEPKCSAPWNPSTKSGLRLTTEKVFLGHAKRRMVGSSLAV